MVIYSVINEYDIFHAQEREAAYAAEQPQGEYRLPTAFDTAYTDLKGVSLSLDAGKTAL